MYESTTLERGVCVCVRACVRARARVCVCGAVRGWRVPHLQFLPADSVGNRPQFVVLFKHLRGRSAVEYMWKQMHKTGGSTAPEY